MSEWQRPGVGNTFPTKMSSVWGVASGRSWMPGFLALRLWPVTLVLAGLAAAQAAITIAVPLHLARLLSSASREMLERQVEITLALLVAAPLLAMGTGLLRAWVQTRWLAEVRHHVERAAVYHTVPDALREPGEVWTRLSNDAGSLVGEVIGATVELPLTLGTFLLLVIAGWRLSHPLTLGMLAPVPLYLTVPVLARGRARRLTQAAREAQADSLTRTQHALSMADVLRLVGPSSQFVPGGQWHEVRRRRLAEQRFAAWVNSLGGSLPSLAQLALMTYGMTLVLEHRLSLGVLLAFLLLSQRVAPTIDTMTRLPMTFQNITLATRRLAPYLHSTPPSWTRADLGPEVAAVIVPVASPHKREYRLPMAGIVLITGANGSGKTTLVRHLVNRAAEPRRYEVCWNAQLGDSLPVAYVPQQPRYIVGTLRDNLLLGRPALHDSDLQAILRDLGWQGPIDLDRAVGPRQPLSGGEARRVALARALLGRPRILIGDEIEDGLDDPMPVITVLTAQVPLLIVVTHEPTRWPTPTARWHIDRQHELGDTAPVLGEGWSVDQPEAVRP